VSKHRAPTRGGFARYLLSVAAAVVVVLGIAVVAQAVVGGSHSASPASRSATSTGHYVKHAAAIELGSRTASSVSRAADRPPALARVHRGTATPAQRRLIAKYKLLRRAADNAEKYAKRLASSKWVYPTTNFHLTELFGVEGPMWASGYHTGIDLATAYGTPVVAVGNGTVVQTGWDGRYGNQVRLQLPNGDQVWYNHLSSIVVTPRQPVLKGETLGRVGDTGNADGYHLHLEYRLAADLTRAVDPLPFFVAHGLPLT
jgi:murein DD-endopeptidase MepM/ murein hydrolase activator NlpD